MQGAGADTVIFADPSDTFEANSSDWLASDSGSTHPTVNTADPMYTFEAKTPYWLSSSHFSGRTLSLYCMFFTASRP